MSRPRAPSDSADPPRAPDRFRPDLEGLRAVAVVLVLLYHARVPGLGGGFVGVDIFFVLSGFLITQLLLRERSRSGTISLTQFYARRARRLLPAAALVLLVTVIASFLILPPLRMPDVGVDAAAASLYVSNIRFALQATDYLQSELAPSPLLHFWSLGVEEQFYLFWPAIVLLVTRGASGAIRRVGATAAVLSLASLAMSLWLTRANGPWAFFSLPTRTWELGLGALLAVAGGSLASLPRALAGGLGWIGVIMIVAAGALLGADTPFPGTAALLPVIGSGLVIAAGARPDPGGPAGLLGSSVPRFLGRISYSLYLWHWPILVLPAAAELPLPGWARAGLVAASIVLAAITQRWVEEPLRHGRVIGTLASANLALAAVTSLALAVGSAALIRIASIHLGGHRAPTASAADDEAALDAILKRAGTGSSAGGPDSADRPVPAGLRPSLRDARDVLPAPYQDGCHVGSPAETSPPCAYGDPAGRSTVVLFGDSHAMSWWPALDRLGRERGWRVVSLTKSGCSSSDVAQWHPGLKRAYSECSAWRESSLARIEKERPALVILANSRALTIAKPDGTQLEGAEELAAWQAGLTRTVTRVAAVPGARVVVIADTPRSRVDVPVCLSSHPDSVRACSTPFEEAVSADWRDAAASAARAGGGAFIDPAPWTCPWSPCPAVIGNFMVLRDKHHLASPFSAALAGRLGAALPPVAPR